MEEVCRIAEPRSGLAELAQVRFRQNTHLQRQAGPATGRSHRAIITVTKHSKYQGDGFRYTAE